MSEVAWAVVSDSASRLPAASKASSDTMPAGTATRV